MKKNWLVKTLALGVVVLFIGTGVVSAFNFNTSNNSKPMDQVNPLNTGCSGTPPVANFTYLVKEGRYVDFNASTSYDPDGTIVRYEWDFGDGSFDFDILYLMDHKYCFNGIFNVALTVIDNDGFTGNLIQPVEINENVPPPCPPSIDGLKSGKPNMDYNYTFISVNPDAEDLFLWIDWGDGTNSSWIGPYYSGELVIRSHRWTEKCMYIIKAKNKDVFCGHESYWAEFEVTMLRNKITTNNLLLRFLERFPILQKLLQQLKL